MVTLQQQLLKMLLQPHGKSSLQMTTQLTQTKERKEKLDKMHSAKL